MHFAHLGRYLGYFHPLFVKQVRHIIRIFRFIRLSRKNYGEVGDSMEGLVPSTDYVAYIVHLLSLSHTLSVHKIDHAF